MPGIESVRFTDNRRPIAITFGALAPSLRQQLKAQGFETLGATIVDLEKDAEAIQRLRIRGLISERVAEQAQKKIVQSIATAVRNKELNRTETLG